MYISYYIHIVYTYASIPAHARNVCARGHARAQACTNIIYREPRKPVKKKHIRKPAKRVSPFSAHHDIIYSYQLYV